MIARILQIWRCSLHVGFALLCLRFLHAVSLEAGANAWLIVGLLGTAFGLGVWRPGAAWFAFTLSVPLLNGLPLLGVAGGSPSAIFAAIWLGVMGRRCVGQAVSEREGAATRSSFPFRFPLFAADILSTALLLSLGTQIWHYRHVSDFWTTFRDTATQGFSDPHYFLTSAFIWLQGLFYFRALWTGGSILGARAPVGTAAVTSPAKSPATEDLSRIPDRGESQRTDGRNLLAGESRPYSSPLQRARGVVRKWLGIKAETNAREREVRTCRTAISAWIRPMFLSTAVTIAVFAFIEFKFHIPEGWVGAGFQSPYEDIFSFGSIAVSAFIFTVAVQRKTVWIKVAVGILYCTGLMGLVVASWSRGTWLAAAIFLLVVGWFRLARWWMMGSLVVAVLSLVIINANATRPSWQNQVYVTRLLGLVRVEKLADKSSGRFDLYNKAFAMIRERPLVGHGIGSFYLTSPSYARTGDPWGTTPNFAHNVFLQIAAEQGVLVAGLFAALIGWVLWRGLRGWQMSDLRDRISTVPKRPPSMERLTLLGTTLALGAYVQTNLTSNSLNIFPSNQFFFWFLMAAVLGMTQSETTCRIAAKETAK